MRSSVILFACVAVVHIGAAANIHSRTEEAYEARDVIEALKRMDSKVGAMERRLEYVEHELKEQRVINIEQKINIEDLQRQLSLKRPRHNSYFNILNSPNSNKSHARDAIISPKVRMGKKLDIWKMVRLLTQSSKKQDKRITALEKSCSQLHLEDKTPPYSKNKGNGEGYGNNTLSAETRITGRQRNIEEIGEPRIKKRALGTIAFSAYLDHEMTEIGIGHIILMQGIILNEGNAYNTYTGVFTVPKDGLYLFTFTFDNYYSHSIRVNLVVNGDMKVGGIIYHGCQTCHQQGGNTVLLRLSVGQSVWLAVAEARDNIYGDTSERYSTFSGILLDG